MFNLIKKIFRRDNKMEENEKKDVEKVDEKKEEVVDQKTEKVENQEGTKPDGKGADVQQESEKEPVTTEQGVVQAVDKVGEGLNITDLVTKADLQASLDALNAKFDALFKELEDKDAKIKELGEKAHGLEDKFVNNGDFGTQVSKNGNPNADAGYETFDSYSAKFED